MKRNFNLLRLVIVLISAMAFTSPQATSPFTGTWKGTLTQPSGKGMVNSYPFMMKVEQVENTVTGYTRLDIKKTDYFAIMTFKGTVSGNTLSFQEDTKIYKQKTTGLMRWYIKKGHLEYNTTTQTLNGTWQVDDDNDKGAITLSRTEETLKLK